MEPNLNIYNIAIRYVIMALFTGVGAGLTSFDGFINTLGYVFMVIGVVFFLMSVLAFDPTKGDNKEAMKQSEQDFIEQ
ncbi:hypothetical protein N9G63_01270 [Chitinophagales bacterium]|jgi:hypothetical protein|nr:hypothetical protein [Chitinophagales bacterium]